VRAGKPSNTGIDGLAAGQSVVIGRTRPFPILFLGHADAAMTGSLRATAMIAHAVLDPARRTHGPLLSRRGAEGSQPPRGVPPETAMSPCLVMRPSWRIEFPN
jgi:hypothetical protein